MCSVQNLWVATNSSQNDVDEPLAFLGCTPKDGMLYIEEVSVHEQWQRRGIARRLIAAAEEQARKEVVHTDVTHYVPRFGLEWTVLSRDWV